MNVRGVDRSAVAYWTQPIGATVAALAAVACSRPS